MPQQVPITFGITGCREKTLITENSDNRHSACMPLLHGRCITFGSLFAGIGGIDLGFENAGMVCKWQVEINAKAREWLAHRWPDAKQHADICDFAGSRVDVIAGGFPCQNLSSANVKTRNGLHGAKSGLWREFYRIVSEVRPVGVLVENVATWRDWVPTVRRDLWRLGYASVSVQLCPSMFGAFHRRPRVFVVANANGKSESLSAIYAEVASLRPASRSIRQRFEDITRFVPRIDGLSAWMARGYGNAVCPVVAEWIGRRVVRSM